MFHMKHSELWIETAKILQPSWPKIRFFKKFDRKNPIRLISEEKT